MAKRGKKVVKERYEFKYRKNFEALIKEQKKDSFLSKFKLKNTNQLWRWDNLNDV
jgi:hypothetical protein